jgi:hypothetical protein
MSSAILYLAIIAIWAGVLIPRWLRRDISRITSAREATSQELATTGDLADDSGTTDIAEEAPDGGDDARDRDFAPDPASREEARRRVLAARRRLLWMLLGLEVAGAGLAVTGLAAWWVLAPPTVMLAGYLALLREAAAADSERAAAEREAMQAREEARKRVVARARHARERQAARRTAAPSVAPAAYAAAPVAADYADLGRARDFTPGLHYAPSDDTADDDAYDQYTENRLRAVGD